MKLHFVCSGNSFRSRLAEAYLNSKKIPALEVSSSGIQAKRNLNGPIAWYAMRIIKYNDLVNFMSDFWRQTTGEMIRKSDTVIFMEKMHYDFCRNFLAPGQKYEIWDIEDVDNIKIEKESDNIKQSEEIFAKIKESVDSLSAIKP
jgi:protein-tyrosine-phosphatase